MFSERACFPSAHANLADPSPQIQIQNNFIVPYTYMYIGFFFYNKVNKLLKTQTIYIYIYMYIFTLKRDW